MAWSDSTMNGCGLVPGWWTTRPNTWPVALFLSGQGPVRRDDVRRRAVVT
ncbi:MAG TPA: hypothetical protein VMH88_11320 [Gemmatimonadales bacterium]|nr:hypothetical protein [Gemmatimonadales bacterium]